MVLNTKSPKQRVYQPFCFCVPPRKKQSVKLGILCVRSNNSRTSKGYALPRLRSAALNFRVCIVRGEIQTVQQAIEAKVK